MSKYNAITKKHMVKRDADSKSKRGQEARHYLTVLDLFAGPGGMSQGIKDARNHNFRFNVVVANDNNNAVKSTYVRNHPGVEFVFGSIAEEDTKKNIESSIQRKTGGSTVDLVVGGPPCKGFSLENKMTRNMGNPMNHLVTHYVEMVRRTKPVAFVMENVPGIFAMQKGNMIEFLIQSFKSLGYHNATAWLLNAADYGVPQVRKRAFIVGSRSRIPIDMPKKTHGSDDDLKRDPSLLRYMKLADAIGDLPKIKQGMTASADIEYSGEPKNDFQRKMRSRSRRVRNHIVTKNTPHVIERIKVVPPGGNWSDIPAILMKVDGKYRNLDAHSMIYKRLLKNKPSITITNFRKAMIIHPSQHRLLSVREAARIQTFPDHFEFEGGISNTQQQVSDAVPVDLAKKVGETMLRHLHDVILISSSPHSLQKQNTA